MELFPEPPAEFATESDAPHTEAPKEELPPFPASTPLLDSKVQRSKVDLGRRRSRARTPQSLRIKAPDSRDWRICDSTDGPSPVTPDQDQDQERVLKQSPPSAPHRVKLFPGVNPSALIAQLKKRTSDRAPDRTPEPSPEQREGPGLHTQTRSLRSPPHAGSTGGSSPAWLQELKSKQRNGET